MIHVLHDFQRLRAVGRDFERRHVQHDARISRLQCDVFVVNLRPDPDTETEFVLFDLPRVVRVLARIAVDLEELARRPAEVAEDRAADPVTWHCYRLAEPEVTLKQLSQREQRAALREELGFPPHERS